MAPLPKKRAKPTYYLPTKAKPPRSTDKRTKTELLETVAAMERMMAVTSSRKERSDRLRAGEQAARRQLADELRALKRERAAEKSGSPLQKQVQEILEGVPEGMRPLLQQIALDPSMNETLLQVLQRERNFETPQRALLAGISMNRAARAFMDAELTKSFLNAPFPPPARRELIVGGGLHAAIYASVRVAMGFPKPIVLERSQRPGGAFAAAYGSVFYLNSRNRPGELSLPGMKGALNILPGAPLQPSEIGGAEYQTNDSLGLLARMSLAMHSECVLGEALDLAAGRANSVIAATSLGAATPGRVIIATGLGDPKGLPRTAPNPRVLNFEQFMQRMDTPFPLRGMKRVAVIGAGDSGKTVIESLAGQGPPMMSAAAIDWPEQIDWYGVPEDRSFRGGWEQCSRSRYKGIGRLLPLGLLSPSRVKPLTAKASRFAVGFNVVYVDDVPYDYVVNCTGYFGNRGVQSEFDFAPYAAGGLTSGLKAPGREVYVVGPAANLPVGLDEEAVLRGIAENKTSLFRYAPRTAALAAALPAP